MSNLKNNTTSLEELLIQINELPDYQEGIDTSDATASTDEIFFGETAYVDGNKVTGTFTIENELDTQDDLISQIQTALQNKASASEPVLQSKTVTPTTSQQYVTPDSNYDGLSKVTVNAIPSTYVQPSGTKTITTNGTHDVKSYASATVNVAGEDITAETNTYTSELADLVTQISALETALQNKAAGGSSGGGSVGGTCTVTMNLPANMCVFGYGDCDVSMNGSSLGQVSIPSELGFKHIMPVATTRIFNNIPIGSIFTFYYSSGIKGASISGDIEFGLANHTVTTGSSCSYAVCRCNGNGTISINI